MKTIISLFRNSLSEDVFKTTTLFLFTLLTVSCSQDIDDNKEINLNNRFEEIIKNQYKSPEGVIYYTGCTDCLRDGTYSTSENNLLIDLTIPNELPESYDLSEFLPPIGNQGRQGSCTSWAVTYYMKSLQERLESELPFNNSRIMSPAYTYNQLSQGICEGTAIASTLNILQEQGTTSIESFPYFDNTCSIQPTEIQLEEAEPNKISDYKYLSGENMVEEMKSLILEETPILISAFLSSEFGKTDNLGLTAYREHAIDFSIPGGCHAMLVVGYSDTNNAFKVVNSWGEDWGDDGFVWFDYAAFENVLDDTATFKVISQAIVAYDL